MTCPGEVELARAVSVGADPALEAHLAGCASCRAAWDGARAAIELARELPAALPPPARREEVRTAILAAAAGQGRGRARRAWLLPAAIAGAAAAASVAGYFALARREPPVARAPHAHGTVRPIRGARYAVASIGPDEVIRLDDGAIDVEVEPLHPGERFRVVVGGAELEVHGTAFRVTARDQRLIAVDVARGRVDLSPGLGAPAVLAAGQSWHAAPVEEAAVGAAAPAIEKPAASDAISVVVIAPPVASPQRASPSHSIVNHPSRIARRAAEPPPAAASPAAASPAAASPAAASPAAASPAEPALAAAAAAAARAPEESTYDDAWAAMRSGDFTRAAGGFARFAVLAPDSPLVEDAGFWRAVALARGKRSADAVTAFHDFLDSFARSPRAGQASAMLGWLLIDARAFDEATTRFQAAAGDPDPSVRNSARAGLEALAQRKR